MAEPITARRRFGARLRAVLWKNLLVLLVLEALARLAAGVGLVSLPPTGVSGFDRDRSGENPADTVRLFEPDVDLIARMRPNISADYPRAVVYGEGERQFHVTTNAAGFRTPPFESGKRPGVLRIVTLGDSSTFGMNLEEPDSYPRRLAALLDERHPGRFEVINLGVPGYSSRQGLELLRQQVLGLDPDVVTFAFGTNDLFWKRPLSDNTLIRLNQSAAGRAAFWLRQALDHVYLYRLMRKVVPLLIRRSYDTRQAGAARCSPEEIAANVVAAEALLEPRGVPLLVLNSDFYNTGASEALRDGAARSGSRFVDLDARLAAERRRRTRAIEAALDLAPLHSADGAVIFRVEAREPKFVHLRVRREGHPDLMVSMLDNGVPPDQTPGDKVWTAQVDARLGEWIGYSYWRGLKPPLIKEFHDGSGFADTERRTRLSAGPGDIDVFGDPLFLSDPTHPNAAGDRLIAALLADEILALPAVQAKLH